MLCIVIICMYIAKVVCNAVTLETWSIRYKNGVSGKSTLERRLLCLRAFGGRKLNSGDYFEFSCF